MAHPKLNLLSLAFLLLPACAAAPDLGSRPLAGAASPIASEQSFGARPDTQWPDAQWWQAFADPQLDSLIAEALADSPDVAAAAARARRATALARAEGAALLPSLDADGSVYKDRRSLNNGFGEEIKPFLPRGWRNGADIAARLDYDIDLWGRSRAALAAATSEARAAALDAREARLLLTTDIASAYADLARLFAERDIRKSALDVRIATRDLVSDRYENGLETAGSLNQAEAEVATANSQLSASEQAIVLRRNQIAFLLGAGPDRGLAISRPGFGGSLAAGVPQEATTELVGRRPEIIAFRERAVAAAARVRAARADFFPAIRLEGLIGLQSIGLGDLFDSDSTYGRAGPAISLPIFRGGALRGRYRAAGAAYDAAVADYERSVLTAYREVADAVTARDSAGSQLADARKALEASEQAYRIARLRYDGGLSPYLDVLALEDRLLIARLAVARLEAETRQYDIALVRALGGGFATETAKISRN